VYASKIIVKGQIISGSFGNLIVRQKTDEDFEIGELLISESNNTRVLLQVTDLSFGSQISQSNLELISGMNLEQGLSADFMDPELRLYNLATVKSILTIKEKAKSAKILPKFFSQVREVKKEDLSFAMPKNPIFFGNLRSGSKVLDVPINLNGKDVLSHHILIPATTGRGKSNLTSVMLWNLTEQDYAGMLVLDPHNEYYERLKNHPSKEKVSYYSPSNVPVGQKTLKINMKILRPDHFNGVAEWSTPQKECLSLAYKEHGELWVESLILDKVVSNVQEATLNVVKRRLMDILNISSDNVNVSSKGIFDLYAGETTISNISDELESGKTVIINTSSCSGRQEILVGSLITTEVFRRYKNYKMSGNLDDKPVISIVLEEAPRVLGKEVLEKGSNIFSTIAREGRKFQVGLIAITQLPSLIPRQVLANMNTKIILGIEMQPERQAIIDSASQDLSDDGRNIASLDKGEAIITSNFSPFAVPVKVPLFDDYAVYEKKEDKHAFSGINIG